MKTSDKLNPAFLSTQTLKDPQGKAKQLKTSLLSRQSSPLGSQIEVSPAPVCENRQLDTLDLDLGSYVESFLEDLQQTMALPQMNLLSAENAAQALQLIASKREEIAAKRRTAQALIRLVEQQ